MVYGYDFLRPLYMAANSSFCFQGNWRGRVEAIPCYAMQGLGLI